MQKKPFKKVGLIFVLLFAAVGGLVIYRSFALSQPDWKMASVKDAADGKTYQAWCSTWYYNSTSYGGLVFCVEEASYGSKYIGRTGNYSLINHTFTATGGWEEVDAGQYPSAEGHSCREGYFLGMGPFKTGYGDVARGFVVSSSWSSGGKRYMSVKFGNYNTYSGQCTTATQVYTFIYGW